MDFAFKLFILCLAGAGFAVSYFSELFVFPQLAVWIGVLRGKLAKGRRKKRKEYKIVLERMKM